MHALVICKKLAGDWQTDQSQDKIQSVAFRKHSRLELTLYRRQLLIKTANMLANCMQASSVRPTVRAQVTQRSARSVRAPVRCAAQKDAKSFDTSKLAALAAAASLMLVSPSLCTKMHLLERKLKTYPQSHSRNRQNVLQSFEMRFCIGNCRHSQASPVNWTTCCPILHLR